ncbi:MAG: isoprenylcysteine carboxylmethyltransferase family protein [Caldisericia bacterium]|nr:isoprenylcysteine carboxylmethyltransferase family protein [Caldisericia bacterium]
MVIKILTLIIWILWLIIYWGGGVNLFKTFIRSYKIKSYFYDKFFILGLVILSNIMLWTGYFSIRLNLNFKIYLNGDFYNIFGFLMVLIGALLSFYGKLQMRESWSAYTKPNDKMIIIDKGLYSIVRHPIYLFSIFMTIGTVLVFPFLWNFICGFLMVLLYIFKMKFEEEMLIKTVPEYKYYMKRVKYKLIPFLF